MGTYCYTLPVKVGDLVTLPEIETVVQLRDTLNPDKSPRLVDSFILTEEVATGLRVILDHVLSLEGGGFFLKGHFGSGKSHFLSYLTLILSDENFLDSFLTQSRVRNSIQGITLEALRPRKIAVIPISLVEYRSTIHLEDILREQLGQRLPSIPLMSNGEESRKVYFERLHESLQNEGYGGLLIAIDELSEFLRSKSSINHFNEDIRFLQFLGEASARQPIWIVGAVQEFLEETGEIHQELFNKINDRYPARIILTSAHVKTLVTELLIQKKADSEEPIRALYRRLQEAFPAWPVSQQEFYDLYPIHPGSIDLLEDLKPLFSKTRGFVDFIHYQVAGDEDRGIEGILEQPHNTLVGPDRIFDHFSERMKSTIEILPYVETVYAFYSKRIPRIFSSVEEQDFAIRLVKLLILVEISPVRRSLNVGQVTEMLLERITDLDPEINYQYTLDIGTELTRHGGFIVHEDTDAPLSEQVFRIQLEASVHSIVERKLEYQRTLLEPMGRQVVARLLSQLVKRLDFFQGMRPNSQENLVLDWQNTRRTGLLFFLPSGETIDQSSVNTDVPVEFELQVITPGEDPPPAKRRLASVRPKPIKDLDRCRMALALFNLLEESREDQSTQGRRIRENLERRVDDALSVVGALYHAAFQKASVIDEDGEILHEFDGTAYSHLRDIVQVAASYLLENRYPKHYLIAPRHNFYPQVALGELSSFFRDMSLDSFKELRWGRTVLEGFLLPCGIIKRRKKQYLFCNSPEECGPLELLAGRVKEEKCGARAAMGLLRESDYGMSEDQFKPFLMAALFGGFLQAFRSGKRVNLTQLDPLRLLEIEELRLGQTVTKEAVLFLNRLDIIPVRFRKPSLSFTECQLCWEEILRFHNDLRSKLEELEGLLQRYGDYRSFQILDMKSLTSALVVVRSVLKSIRVSRPAIEGLEGFVKDSGSPEELNKSVKAVQEAHRFFSDGFGSYSFMVGYLSQVSTSLPHRDRYRSIIDTYQDVWNCFQDWDPSVGAEEFENLKADFETWRQLYVPVYREEHDRFNQHSDFETVGKLLEDPALNLLSRLEQLDAFIPAQPSRAFREAIADRLSKRCQRPVWEQLQQRPICSCEFHLGTELPRLRPEAISRDLMSQLDQFAAQVQHPRFRELLDRYEFHLQQSGAEKRFQSAINALKTAGSGDDLLEADELLNPTFLQNFNRFEPGKRPFRVKSFREFRQRLGNVPRLRKEIVQAFEDWLSEGESDEEEPVLLTDQEIPAVSDLWAELEETVKEVAPKLLGELQRLTSDEFLFRTLSTGFYRRHSLNLEQASKRLPLFPPEKLFDDYRSLAVALEERGFGWLADIWKSWDSQLDQKAFSALGLLPDKSRKLCQIFLRESNVHSLIREVGLRLLQKVVCSLPSELEQIRAGLQEGRKKSRKTAHIGRDWIHLLDAAASTQGVRTGLERMVKSGFGGLRKLERIYCEKVSLLPYLLDRMHVFLKQIEAESHLDFKSFQSDCYQLLERFEKEYEQCITENEEKLPTVLEILQKDTSELAAQVESEAIRFIFVDAMSWSLWTRFRTALEKSLPAEVRLLAEKRAYAHLPSNTEEQLSRWLKSNEFPEQLRLQKGFTASHQPSEGGSPTTTSERIFQRIDWVDEKVHTSRESLYFLFDEVTEQLVRQILSLMAVEQKNTLFVMFADHGFRENPAFNPHEKYRYPRYTHGGASPAERLVPVGFFVKKGSRHLSVR